MWDGTPPGARRGARGSDPAASRRGPAWQGAPASAPRQGPPGAPGPDRSRNPYRPYGEQSAPRVPAYRRPPAAYPGMPTDPGMSTSGWTDAELASVHHRRVGLAIFHDGNPGHLWRGEVASRLGETVLAAGTIMWLFDLIDTPVSVLLAVLALGLPFLLAPVLVVPFENASEPGVPLKWIGRVRLVFALALIAMHYHTILPVVYGLLFVISLCGRLHDATRVAAMRTCLAPGEPEHVANDTHIGAAIAAVIGPLLASLCYIITGERILGVSVGAAVLFLISLNSESFLDALEPPRRAFLLATPESVAVDDSALDALAHEDEDDDIDPEDRREFRLPEWYQQGPESAGNAIADILTGVGLAGGASDSVAGIWALGALALVGGGLSVLEVFYVTTVALLPAFYLGPLLAAEGAGMAVGVAIAGRMFNSLWRPVLVVGVAGTGVALAALVLFPSLPIVLLVALGLGFANALAVCVARYALLHGFDGIERRAIASAEGWLTGASALVGGLLFTVIYSSPAALPIRLPDRLLPQWPLPSLLLLTGVGLVVAAPLLVVLSAYKPKRKPKAKAAKKRAASASNGRAPSRLPALQDDEDTDDDSAYLPATGEHDAWDEDEYAESYPVQTGYDDAVDVDDPYAYDDYPDPGRSSRSSRQPPRQNRRPRW